MRDIFVCKGKIWLGMQRENEARRVVFDVEDYSGSVDVIVKRSRNEIPYPAQNVEIEDGKVYWILSDLDTGVPGYGSVQIVFKSGEVVEKTVVFDTLVSASLDDPGSYPTPEESWLDQMIEYTQRAEAAAAAAEASAESAESIIATDAEASDYFGG